MTSMPVYSRDGSHDAPLMASSKSHGGFMELRLLSTAAERRRFARHLTEPKATANEVLPEITQLAVSQIHLNFADLYALSDERAAAPGGMLAGFAIHDLARFAQCYPRPDLTRWPSGSVFECGELWSKLPAGGGLARHALWILAGLLKANALLAYPVVKPCDTTGLYDGLKRIGQPIAWPYARSRTGGKIIVQAMLLEGAELERMARRASSCGFEIMDPERRRFRFNIPAIS
jgi:hypothetical protein